MVCDEVTSGLDPQSEDQILALLRNLAETNHKSFVCIIHNLGKLNQFDWVTVVYQGDVVFQGSPDALLGYFGIPDGLRLYEVLNASDLATWRDRWAIHQAEHQNSYEVAVAKVGAPSVIERCRNPRFLTVSRSSSRCFPVGSNCSSATQVTLV